MSVRPFACPSNRRGGVGSARIVGGYILLVALVLGVYGLISGNYPFLGLGLLLMLYVIGSSFVLSLQDAKERRKHMLQKLGIPPEDKK